MGLRYMTLNRMGNTAARDTQLNSTRLCAQNGVGESIPLYRISSCRFWSRHDRLVVPRLAWVKALDWH